MNRFKNSIGGAVALSLLAGSAVADSASRWTMWSEKPAETWEDSFVTGNGRHGTMVTGRTGADSIICVHEELWMPAWPRETDALPKLAHLLPKVREMIRADKSQEAINMVYAEAFKQLKPKGIREGWPCSPHPAFDIRMNYSTSGETAETVRRLNLETGEAFSAWSDEQNDVEQRVFSSRTDNVNVVELRAVNGKKLNLEVFLQETPGRPKGKHVYRNIPMGDQAFNFVEVGAEKGWLYYHADYAYDRRGYEGVGRVTLSGGTMTEKDGRLQIQDADRVLLVVRIQPLEQGEKSERSKIQAVLKKMPKIYDQLLKPHAAEHGEMFRRVTFDLGAEKAWKNTSNEQLQSDMKANGVSPHFLEKTHAMGRYILISTCGRYPAPLQGMWGGSWKPSWGGSFTTDANVNLAVSSMSMGNLPECAETYFGWVERQLPGWRANAKRFMGCRGILSSLNMDPETGYQTHYTRNHFMAYWPGGTGWNIRPFYDYGVLMNDREFLKTRVLPLYLELADFYEDYLVREDDGSLTIIPSQSPENRPGSITKGVRHNLVVENSTFDVAVAREVYAILIELGEEFGLDKAKIKTWQAMRNALPAYRINDQGALAEWIPEKYLDRYNHRHNSHLYPLFPGMEFKEPGVDPALVEAAQVALDRRYKFDTSSAFGLIQAAMTAARLGDVDKVESNLNRLSRRNYFYEAFVTSHEPDQHVYNMDAILSLPRLVMEALVFSRPGFIELLPAWPESYADGSLNGVLIRGGHKMDLSWENGKLASATLYAGADGPCEIKVGDQSRTLELKAGKTYRLNAQLDAM